MNAVGRENLTIGRAVNRAAETLPEGWEILITMGWDAVTVEAVSPDGDVLRIDCGDLSSEQIVSAIVRAAASVGGSQP